ncbi:MAG TPA: LptA/OstA family protein, partial [Pyrinomonadaceae bacterium]|nr:LptA/OstA family protein [Pyrinomonadaceae bacterium]
ANPAEYSKVTMSAASAIRVFFKGEGAIERMLTQGRTTIKLDAPSGQADAADKRITADTVKTIFDSAGKNIQKAEAAGAAELYVEPLQARPENYKTTVDAPRFDCEFFPEGNNAKTCIAATKTQTVRVPTVVADGRGTQALTADKLTANFNAQTRDVESLDADGSAKFVELDRNAVSDQISFTQSDQVVRLRGGEPTVWDSRARAKAREIDWDTRNQRSALRGGVSTTYYSQKQTGGATPFGQIDKPVYITAANGDFDHRAQTALYTGNARGWQENNYVRAESLFIRQNEGLFTADGSVQSLLYNAKRKEDGRESNVPVFAASKRMTYDRDGRVLHYESAVDIRQGNDRIVGGAANVYIDEKGDVTRTDVENNVVITQPNRKAVGDFAQYVAADQSVVLRGNPARVQDAENGSSEGGQLTVYLDENRVIGEGKTKQNTTGRTRSVYKVKNNQDR